MMGREEVPSSTYASEESPDCLTRILIGVALFSVVMIVILAATLWSDRGSDELQATSRSGLEIQPSPIPVTPSPTPVPITPPPCVAPYDWTTYTIRQGDTLYSLAERYGTDIESLRTVNCIEGNIIVLGQELYVPLAPGARAAATAAAQAQVAVGVQPTAQLVAGEQPAPESETSEAFVPMENVQAEFPDRYVNIILLGSDKREGSGAWRTDTMIVVTVDTERQVVRLLSIPRDLWVYIPGHGFDRVNTAELWGELIEEGTGPQLVKQTIYENLGIPIHYYARVDFKGFKEIIDAIGGVDIDVECALTDIELEPGMHHMDGDLALLYARSRITTNDFDRGRRQRKLLMALWDKGLSKQTVLRIPALWSAMSDAFETDMPLDKVIALAYVGLQMQRNSIYSQSIGPWQVENWTTPEGAAVLLPQNEEIQSLLTAFYGPIDYDFLDRVGQTSVSVLDASYIPDADRLVATELGWAGFPVQGTEVVNPGTYPTTQIIVYHADPDVAEALAQILDMMPSVLVYQPDPSSPVAIQVILGADYDPCR
jgi:LCP family protein required for cell wall assembly